MAKMSKPGAVLTERKEYYCTPLVPASTCGNLLDHFFPLFSLLLCCSIFDKHSALSPERNSTEGKITKQLQTGFRKTQNKAWPSRKRKSPSSMWAVMSASSRQDLNRSSQTIPLTKHRDQHSSFLMGNP